MNTFLAGLLVVAGGGAAVPDAPADEATWATLDKQVERLAESLQEDVGPRVGLLMRLNYSNSGDLQVGANDLGGVLWDNLRVSVRGWVNDFEYRIQTESAVAGALGPVAILDAWTRTPLTDFVRVTLGLFSQPFLRSSGIEPQNLLFIERTTDAQFWNSRDQGVMLDGSLGAVDWGIAVANGTDFAGKDPAYSGQIAIQALGGGVDVVQGAYGKDGDLRATAVVSLHENQNAIGEGNVFALEVVGAWNRWYASVEHLNYGDDGGVAGSGVFAAASDTAPIAAVLSFMFVEDKYEAAIRYQGLDDSFGTEALTFGVNRYYEGHNLMWQMNFTDRHADAPASDAQTFAIGLTASL